MCVLIYNIKLIQFIMLILSKNKQVNYYEDSNNNSTI